MPCATRCQAMHAGGAMHACEQRLLPPDDDAVLQVDQVVCLAGRRRYTIGLQAPPTVQGD